MNINFNINDNLPLQHPSEYSFYKSLEGSQPLVKNHKVFKGEEGNPFLAPRAVWKVGTKLLVSDTGQNRVFIWNDIPKTEFQAPDVVIGQINKDNTGRNSGKTTSASSLQYPSGVWSDGEKLIVADAWNHRVLIWHTFPTENGQAADVVIGQPDFEHNETNVKGLGSNPDANTLNWPYGVFSDGKQLWIADTGNRRVLYFDKIPNENFARANDVIGKEHFNERDYEDEDAVWPYSVRVSEKGQLSIADTQFYRNLIWKDWKTAFTQRADFIIGQPDFISSGQNQFGLFPKENTLSWTYDSFFYKNGIFIADTGNSRILWFENIPNENAADALNLIGHISFNVGSENNETKYGTERQLYWPFSLCVNNDQLVLADTGNHRIIIFDLCI